MKVTSSAHKPTKPHKPLGFRIHAIVFILTLALLLAINASTGAPYWVHWVVLGWASACSRTGFSCSAPVPTGPSLVERTSPWH